MKKKNKQIRKEEIAEDWCFGCKDGGKFRVCDYKDCRKVYHPECVGKDDSFLEAKDRWTCNWHLCFLCRKASKFRCFCCTTSVCALCINYAEFVVIKGTKGFCNHCIKLVRLIEEGRDVDSDGGKVNFREKNTLEFLFMEYWELLKKKENVTLETIQSAYTRLKKGRKYIVGSELDEINSSEEEDETLVSDYDYSDDIVQTKKRKIAKTPSNVKTKIVSSKHKEFVGWGSKSLLEFLEAIGKDTTTKLTTDDVTSIIIDYAQRKKLFHPKKKKNILCDAILYSLLRKRSINKNRVHNLLEAHFIENFVKSEEEDNGDQDSSGISKDSYDENVSGDLKRERNSTPKKTSQKKVPLEVVKSIYVSIVEQNMKLVYLRRSLIENLMENLETFENKVVGSFVRVKSDPYDYRQKTSHQLLQVTGIKKNLTSGKNEPEILLQISNRAKDFPISTLSDDYFTKEECEDLSQKVKGGLHKNPTIVEFEQKVRTLHEDITNHWIPRELIRLKNLINQANEKGWRRELFQYSDRLQLLQTSSEQSRLLNEVPEVIGVPVETQPSSEHSLGEDNMEIDAEEEEITIAVTQKTSTEENHRTEEESYPEEMPPHQEENLHQPPNIEQVSLKKRRTLILLSDDDDEDEISAVGVTGNSIIREEEPELSMWHFRNSLGEAGPFSLSFLKRLCDASTYALNFKVWKTGQSEDDAILMSDAMRKFFL